MSTQQTPTAAQPSTDQPRLTTRNAPRTFDPFNTNDTPQMFADKWQDIEQN